MSLVGRAGFVHRVINSFLGSRASFGRKCRIDSPSCIGSDILEKDTTRCVVATLGGASLLNRDDPGAFMPGHGSFCVEGSARVCLSATTRLRDRYVVILKLLQLVRLSIE